MRPSRRPRLITALIALFSVLFMQLAVAAHACPQLAQRDQAAAMHMDGCGHADSAQSALCDSHCQSDSQAPDKPALPDVSPFLAAALVSASIAARVPDLSRAAELFSIHITAPPLAIRHCCLRI